MSTWPGRRHFHPTHTTDWIMFPSATYGSWQKAPLEAWDAPLTLP